jgi:hypothetical protein
MTVSERELEENEAKVDNLLHKITEAARQIQDLRGSLKREVDPEQVKRTLDDIDLLAQTIEELARHADVLDVQDEELTQGLEREIKNSLDEAIVRIMNARRTLP